MLQDKLNLNGAKEKYSCATCAEAFAQLKIVNGNRWAAIMLEQVKHGRPVFPTLSDMYEAYKIDYDSHGAWPLHDFKPSENSYVEFKRNDIFPHDGSIGFVRYTKYTKTDEEEKKEVYKMKIGKAVRESLLSMTNDLCEKAITYIMERTTSEWRARQMSEDDYELRVDEDFEFIYDSDNYEDYLGSCQADGNNYGFYNLIKGAKAASLLNENGKILCRAILFTEIHHKSDPEKVVRGIERMYAVGGRMDYKQIFLERLKKDNLIDIYKDFNAGAYDERTWRDIHDERYDEDMYVEFVRPLEDDDPVSWMDTFFQTDGRTKCCNYCFGSYEIRKSEHEVTWYDIKDEGVYDEWLEDYVRGIDEDDLELVYDGSRSYYVCPDTRDRYFHYCEDTEQWQHESNCYWSEHDDCYYEDAVYSDFYDSYIKSDDAIRYHTKSGGRDYAYEDDLYELEDGEYILDDDDVRYIVVDGIKYEAVGIDD